MKVRFSVRDMVLIALFAALTAILAYLTIPLPAGLPPITGQSFAVMLSGLLLGARRGAMSQIVYLLLGIAGLPVFAGGRAGIGILAGPTGGFIWGFVIGALIIGKLTDYRSETLLRNYTSHGHVSFGYMLAAAAIGGIVALYLPGILQLAYVLQLPLYRAALAMLPYLPGDAVKVLVSALLAVKIRPAIHAARH